MLTVLTPVFNEEANLPEFYRRVSAVMEELGEPYEVIFVDDGSSDSSLEMMHGFCSDDPRVKVISLSRNFGHQVAICAGMDHASGEFVAIMDSDLQDPPEVLPQFFAKAKEGFDVVYAIRKNRKEGVFKKAAYSSFYRILRFMAEVDIPLDSGDFCVLSRRALDSLLDMPERNRFVRGLRSWVGFKQIGLEYDRDSRYAGEVKYTLVGLLKLAMIGFVSFSLVPLRLVTLFGLLVSASSFVAILGIFYLSFFTSKTQAVPGWASVAVVVLFLGGVQLVAIGIIGEYIGRIYEEVKRRPLYIARDKVGFDE